MVKNILEQWVDDHKDDPDHESAVWSYSKNKALYDQRIDAPGAEISVCKYCSYPTVKGMSSIDDEMEKLQVCSLHHFWLHRQGYAKGVPRGAIIVNGRQYRDGGNTFGETKFNGFGGAIFKYRRLGEEEVKETNNMWSQGLLPRFLSVEDTHEFVK